MESHVPKISAGGWRLSFRRFVDRHKALQWPGKYAAIEIAVFLALATAAYFLGRHLFDASLPGEGDVRAHIFKIEVLQSYLSHFSWPQWVPWWYQGIPIDQFYPPGFYFLGAIFSFIFRDAVVAYKVLLLLALMLNGLTIYYFSRRFLKFDSHLSIWALLAYETSTPLLTNFMYGEGPNLLGFCVTLVFLTIYLSRVMENKTRGVIDIALPGLVLGIAILIHPFPVIFAVMAIVLFHIIWLIHNRSWKTFIRSQLPYFVAVFVVGGLVGMYYWLPAFLTLNYSSPIYSFIKFMWPEGTRYLLVILFTALTVAAITRFKIRGDVRLDFLIACFCLASALGFGATNYLPFGLGSLVQEFRFATILIPFFGILLILFPLKYKLVRFNMGKLATAIVIGIFVSALIYSLDKREAFASELSAVPHLGIGSFYNVVARMFSSGFPSFAIATLPYITVIFYIALSLWGKVKDIGKSKPAYVLAGGACLILITSFIPYINTDKQANLNRLYSYVDYYQKPEYSQLLQSAAGGRLVIPMAKGYLIQGDNPVTFAWKWGIETDNGPYNQGDPKFFKFSVHLEWEERWLDYEHTRENLMQESASKNIFIWDSQSFPANMNGLTPTMQNNYGKLLTLDQTVSRSVKVTPILTDVRDIREVTEFFNILLQDGYKLVLADVNDDAADMKNKFEYVMIDDPAKVSDYPGKTVFLLNNSDNPNIQESNGLISLNLPYLNYTKIFYHGDEANGNMWIGWDSWPGAKITPEIQTGLDNISQIMTGYMNKLSYEPAKYNLTDNRIDLKTSPGFTLVKDTYFPYWKSEQGNIMSTSQGFMLVYSDASDFSLNYQKPFYYRLAAFFSIFGLLAFGAILIVTKFYPRKKLSLNNFL